MAHAQTKEPVSADEVWIEFPAACSVPETIIVVLNGKEYESFKAKHINGKYDAWTGNWRSALNQKTFDARSAKASLRLYGARSDCRPAGEPIKDPTASNAWAAKFDFGCNIAPVHDIKLATNPALHVSYVRRSKKIDPDSLDCEETGIYKGAPITDVRVKGEEVRLQLGERQPQTRALGILVDYNVLKKHGKPTGTAHLDKDGLEKALADFRNHGDASAPALSGIAIDIDDAKLKRIQFESVDVTVTP